MTPFLAIPNELRNQIITIVVSTPRLAPNNDTIEERPRPKLRHISRIAVASNNVVDDSVTNRTDLIPLILVNRQVHHETLYAISQLPNKHSYEQDILLVDETRIWSTWLLVPELSPVIDKVYAKFRFGKPKDCHLSVRPAFKGGCGGLPIIYWYFYILLKRSLSFRQAGQPETVIKIIELDVISPSPHGHLSTHRSTEDEQSLSTPEGRCQEIRNTLLWGIRYVLSMSDMEVSECEILYRGLGKLRFLQDGVVFREWDIGDELEKVELSQAINFPPLFEQWRSRIREERVSRGLHIGKLSAEESP